jgi:hypothetical protein
MQSVRRPTLGTAIADVPVALWNATGGYVVAGYERAGEVLSDLSRGDFSAAGRKAISLGWDYSPLGMAVNQVVGFGTMACHVATGVADAVVATIEGDPDRAEAALQPLANAGVLTIAQLLMMKVASGAVPPGSSYTFSVPRCVPVTTVSASGTLAVSWPCQLGSVTILVTQTQVRILTGGLAFAMHASQGQPGKEKTVYDKSELSGPRSHIKEKTPQEFGRARWSREEALHDAVNELLLNPKTPPDVRAHIEKTGTLPEGWVLGHFPGKEAKLGYDYLHSRPITVAQNVAEEAARRLVERLRRLPWARVVE